MRKIHKILLLTVAATTALLAGSCIKNDIPYPTVELSIASVTGEGFTLSEIDVSKRNITLTLDEGTDIQHVRIDQVTYDATVHSITLDKEKLLKQVRSSAVLTGEFDLRSPIYTTLSLYQDYAWTIRAEQQIARRFSVAGQVGATVFDYRNRTATAYVAKKTDLSQISVTELKLNAADITTYSPTAAELSELGFATVRFVDVTCHGRTERWILHVLPTDKTVELTRVDAWSKVLWLYGEGVEGQPMGFRYRKQGATDWTDVKAVVTGGSFSAEVAADPQTAYEVVAYCGEEVTDLQQITTDPVQALTNGGFEAWSTIKDIVYPYNETDTPYWGTGNKGAAVAGETLTKEGAPRPGSTGKYSANLKSVFANVAGIGKFAAGNLFVGEYVRNEGTNGVLTFGRSFTLRPKALRIWVKYNRGVIDKVKTRPAGSTIKIGDPDNGIVYIALGTWTAAEYGKDSKGNLTGTADSPICVDTRDVGTFFKSNGKDVVGYGEYVMEESVETWKQVTIPITYTATNIRPTHLMIVCSASRWGDYFTGSTTSEMWVDDFELVYE